MKNMKINPHTGINDILFSDNYETVSRKLKKYDFSVNERKFMNKTYPTFYIEALKATIIFKEDEQSIDCFELDNNKCVLGDLKIFDYKYEELLQKFKDRGNELSDDSEGFEIDDLSMSINFNLPKENSYPISVVLYPNNDYKSKTGPQDIIKHYLGNEALNKLLEAEAKNKKV